MLGLIGDADSVELKLTVPDEDRQSAARRWASTRWTRHPAGVLLRHAGPRPRRRGVVVRARRTQGAPDDTVVKLRPVIPDELPAGCERARTSSSRSTPCRAATSAPRRSREQAGRASRRRWRGSAVRKLFSKPQRAFFADHAPEGLDLDDLICSARSPCFKLKVLPERPRAKLAVELWLYPDGSRIMELSTKCAPADWFEATSQSRDHLLESA